jgi:hypothetical protein
MFALRNRAITTLIGDSGGFQVQNRSIKWEGDKTRNRMLRWLEDMADYSMILDFPTGGINLGALDPHIKRLLNEKADLYGFCKQLGWDPNDHQKLAFTACLYQTLENNDYFERHRVPGKTKLLNVLQGRNVEESDIWYENVKKYSYAKTDGPSFEGWALAGPHKENMEMTLKRLLVMANDGLLQNKDWIHVLGVGKLTLGAIYTSIQRAIRDSKINPKLTMSYDVSSPFTLAAFGKCFWGYSLEKSGWAIHGDKVENRNGLPGGTQAKRPFLDFISELWNRKGLKTIEEGGTSRFVETEVGKRLTLDQVCVNPEEHWTSTWDIQTYTVMMNHNLQVHLEAIFESQDLYDKGDVNHVPDGLLVLKDLIPRIFKSENPFDMISKNRKALNYLANENAERGIQDLQDFEMASISSHLEQLEKFEEQTKIKDNKFQKDLRDFNLSNEDHYQDELKKLNTILKPIERNMKITSIFE